MRKQNKKIETPKTIEKKTTKTAQDVSADVSLVKTIQVKAPKKYKGILEVKIEIGSYFSVTGTVATDKEKAIGDFQIGGCIHDLILKACPHLQPLVDVHLCDYPSGIPMHAKENGFYFLAGALGGLSVDYSGIDAGDCENDFITELQKRKDRCIESVVSTTAMTRDEVEEMVKGITQNARNSFYKYVDSVLLQRWRSRADKARELFETL